MGELNMKATDYHSERDGDLSRFGTIIFILTGFIVVVLEKTEKVKNFIGRIFVGQV